MATGALPKIGASLERGLKACDALLNSISLGASDRNAYRSVLLCRLETQYTLALMRYGLGLEPAAGKSRIKIAWPSDLEKVSQLLRAAISGMQGGDCASAARSVADADRILGHIVAKLRGKKPVAEKAGKEAESEG